MLNSRQIREIVAFDRQARCRHEYDTRRYGTLSKRSLAYQSTRVASADPFGGMPPPASKDPYWTPGSDEGKPTRKTLRYNYIVPEKKLRGKNAERRNRLEREVKVYHVAVRLNRAFCPVVKDVAHFTPKTNETEFRDIGYHGLGGWIVYWDRKDYENKSINAWICPSGLGSWHKHPCKWSDGLKFPWHETINPDALKGTRYEWSQYADGKGGCGVCDWLWLYRQEPHVETLAKLGISRFVTPYAMKALKDRRVMDWVKANLETLRKSFQVKEAIWAAKHGKTLREARNHFRLVEEITSRWSHRNRYYRDPNDNVRVRFDYELLGKLMKKWHVQPADYVRYLEEASRAGQDLRNWGTLYPPTKGGSAAFIARTEAFEREGDRRDNNRRRNERRRQRAAEQAKIERMKKLMAVRGPEIERFQKSLDRTKTLSGCGYKLILAKTQEELRQEGKRMHNCVGCGTYGEGIVMGDTLILTIAGKKDERYCVEISRSNWKVRQCYAPHNSPAPDEIHALADSAAKELKTIFKKLNKKRKAA